MEAADATSTPGLPGDPLAGPLADLLLGLALAHAARRALPPY